MTSALETARAMVAGVVAGGLRRAVFAPGSRSAPLVYAALEAAERGQLELTVRTDERVAAFTALGMAAASGEPAAVVTTSGTAVANLHPAVMEAAASRWPLIVISADRPAELQGVGANQTTDQRRVFGAAPGWQETAPAGLGPGRAYRLGLAAARAARGCRSAVPGPAHINAQFREPLVPGPDWMAMVAAPDLPAPDSAATISGQRLNQGEAGGGDEMVPVRLEPGPKTVVVAGFGAGPQARELAEEAGWPLIAEPASGAWAGPNAITAGRLVLAAAPSLCGQIERLVVYGRPVLSRPVTRLVQDPAVQTVIVHRGGGAWFDLGRAASRIASRVLFPAASAGQRCPERAWLEAWLQAGRTVGRQLAAAPFPNGPAVAAAVMGWLASQGADAAVPPAHPSPLVAGASSAIRDLDLAPAPPTGAAVWAMRGLAGIDGTVSFAGGVALATGQPTTVLLGDLALAHDVGGLAVPSTEKRPDLRIVVLDDQGGAIFENLEPAGLGLELAFERFFATPLPINWRALAQAHGVSYNTAHMARELAASLDEPIRGISLVRVPLRRAERRGADNKTVELSRSALSLPGNSQECGRIHPG
ncbi:MAG: 2-succinyl-5-enolpyruvyl-6-hydroxy-3-cyclohexene-1-carboxylic-acid synthase [Bifidobacteriaceae bacterium]|jgi:2-succinyl-5-enolpyruvyl-6-hydroxy-3-cyclohexene-1-carboxylate synthase|nr:2-succinyl-5-enolpyruvyl-6-hydroxy-3-cyclohexene-1-carboxylic-acid synthase [Bifidobacteriaceae bacterium]